MGIFRRLYHFLVPHESNNHRAKALHHEALFAYILLLGIFNLSITFVHKRAPSILGYATDIRMEQLLTDTNVKRTQAGLAPLTLSETLSQAAAAKAADMFANNYWAHNSPIGKTPWDFIIASGYRYTLAGENLAKNFQTSGGVVDAWMASPSHRDNVLKEGYREVGFAVVNGVLNGEETTLVVQMFGTTSTKPVAQIPQVQASAPQSESSEGLMPTEVPAEPAAQVTAAAVPSRASPIMTLGSVRIAPLVNISGLTHKVAYGFVGLLVGVLAVDAYIVSRRKLVRLAGHNSAHILFLSTIVANGLMLARGVLI